MESNKYTICVDCQHCEYVGHIKEVKDGVWYDYRCKSPKKQILRTINFVTGFSEPQDTRPFCKDVNNGNCDGFLKIK